MICFVLSSCVIYFDAQYMDCAKDNDTDPKMFRVILCVVLVLGHVGSSVINRTRTDFEKSIFDFYRAPRSSDEHASHMPIKEDPRITFPENDDVDKAFVPQKLLDSIFGTSASKPGAEPSAAQNHSTFSERKQETDTRPIRDRTQHPPIDLDISVLNNIWGAPATGSTSQDGQNTKKFSEKSNSSNAESFILGTDSKKNHDSTNISAESMISTERYPSTTNQTGKSFSTDIRFLSETLLRTNWLDNIQATPANVQTKHSRIPKDAQTGPSVPGKEGLKPRNEETIAKDDVLRPTPASSLEKRDITPLPDQRSIPRTANVFVPTTATITDKINFEPSPAERTISHPDHVPLPSTDASLVKNASSKRCISNYFVLIVTYLSVFLFK